LPAVTTGLSRVDSWQEQHELVGLEDAVVASRLSAAVQGWQVSGSPSRNRSHDRQQGDDRCTSL